jgi:hypothetical protein
VVPSLNLVVVRNGETIAPPNKPVRGQKPDVFKLYHDPRAKVLYEPLMDAVTDRPGASGKAPYPPSPVIAGITWAPADTIGG